MTSDDCAWLDARIAKTKELIERYEDAIAAVGAGGGMQSYTLDTGQSRQTVTRADLGRLQDMLNSLENRLSTLQARRNGAGVRVLPGW
jgi:hypothetical protein